MQLLIAFGPTPPGDMLRDLPSATTRIIADAAPPTGFGWQQLSAMLAPATMDEALSHLQRLNALRDGHGERYAKAIRYHDYEPWWFQQQAAFDDYLRPFVRYQRLLTECVAAERVIVWNCPDDLRRLLRLVPIERGVQFRSVTEKSKPFLRARQIGSGLFYRAVTSLAIARAALKHPHDIVFAFDALDQHGRNPWIDGLYRSLQRRGISYLDVVWSLSGARAAGHWRRHRRPAVYCQAIAPRRQMAAQTPRAATTGDTMVDQFLHNLAMHVLLPGCSYSLKAIPRYERLLQRIRPRGAYFMDDHVHAFELLVACRRRGIPTVGVQHGQFSRYTAGLMGYGFDGGNDQSFDRYCVWGDHFKQLLTRHSELISPDSIVVAGSPRVMVDMPKAAGGEVVLFLAEQYEAAVQQEEVSPYVRALAAAGLDVRLKLHPAMAQTPIMSRDEATGRSARVIEGRLDKHLAHTNVVVGSFSSAIFEAILYERPVVLFTTSVYQDPHGLAQAGIVDIATSPADMIALVQTAARLPEAELRRRRELVWGPDARDGGDVAVAEMAALRNRTGTGTG